MKKRVRKKSADDDPVCICGYPRIGLPAIGSPCPECGSTKLAVYQRSFSYYGWIFACAGAFITFVHTVAELGTIITSSGLPRTLYLGPWRFVSVPFGFISLICTAISMVKREPRRKSLRNVGMALLSGLGYPIAGFIFLLMIFYATGGI